ncbi:unnamed protein product [Litomosoides sigmodontis]|uniref:SMB domain-containing protein n=1 Tax=Litomosoides sigmodontis TaxID=42156 RepID=A0A3P6TMR6_LITSI|nr:unnamed protein product [Litomosoides sigmodontis]
MRGVVIATNFCSINDRAWWTRKMLISVSDWLLTVLCIVLALASISQSGCYQKRLCCLGDNYTCVAVDDAIVVGQLAAKFQRQGSPKSQRGKRMNRKVKRTSKLILQDLLTLDDNSMKFATVTNDAYNLLKGSVKKRGEEKQATKFLSRTTTTLPSFRYQLTFGQPFYEKEEKPEKTRYYQRNKLIRYSLLDRYMPLAIKNSRGIEWSSNQTKLELRASNGMPHDRLCYCDEKCVTFQDCCSDYSSTCPPSDCVPNEWSTWSDCIPDEGNCGAGVQTRTRTISRRAEHGGMECPSLIEKMSCFKECPENGQQQYQSEVTPVALILDYLYKEAREKSSSGYIHRGVADNGSKLIYYCGIYELGWVNSNCVDEKITGKLYTGNSICVECQPEAQTHGNTNTCISDSRDGENGFWKLIGPKSCNGIWKRLFRTDSCRCGTNFPMHDAFLFV